jgi:hypothetical protein
MLLHAVLLEACWGRLRGETGLDALQLWMVSEADTSSSTQTTLLSCRECP